MKTSDQINELATALSKAQGEIQDADPSGANKHLQSKYATLTDVLQKIRPAFSKHGLSLMQIPDVRMETGQPVLITTVMHTSGQYISGEIELLLFKKDMQGLGAALTYAKRQAATGMAGLSAEHDDDGESVKADPRQKEPVNMKTQEPKKDIKFMDDAKRKRLWAVCKEEAKWTEEQLKSFIKGQFGYDSTMDLSREHFELIIAHLKAKKSPSAEASL